MGQYYKACVRAKQGRIFKSFRTWDTDNGAKLMEHSYFKNNYVDSIMSQILNSPKHIVWAGDYADNEPGKEENLYFLSKECKMPRMKPYIDSVRYLVNITKHQFVDLEKAEKTNKIKYSWGSYSIHPLPLLTADGNGRGGGDYWGVNQEELVGSWRGDLIACYNDKARFITELDKKENWTELKAVFKEKREDD